MAAITNTAQTQHNIQNLPDATTQQLPFDLGSARDQVLTWINPHEGNPSLATTTAQNWRPFRRAPTFSKISEN